MSVTIPTTEQIELSLQDVFTETFGSDVNFDPSTPTGQLVSNLTGAMQNLWEGIQTVYSASRADQASGQQLDDLAALLNIKRSDGLKTICYSCTLAGTNGTVIPKGTQAEDANGIIFESAVIATITAGIATVDFVSRDPGVYSVPAGTLTTIVTPITGWTSITNPTAGKDGAGDQTDTQLRLDILTRSQNLASGLEGSIRSAIEGVPGVLSAFVFVNYTALVSPPPYSIPGRNIICVVRYDDVSIEDDIAKAIYSRLPCCTTVNTILGGTAKDTVVLVNGFDFHILYNQSSTTPVNFIIDITQETDFSADDEAAMKNAITTYITDNMVVHGSLVYSKIYNYVLNAVPNAIVQSFYMSKNATPISTDVVTVTCDFWSMLIPGTITVNYGS